MASESSDAEVLMPALGRHFQLGTLYNAREDGIMSGNLFYSSCLILHASAYNLKIITYLI